MSVVDLIKYVEFDLTIQPILMQNEAVYFIILWSGTTKQNQAAIQNPFKRTRVWHMA